MQVQTRYHAGDMIGGRYQVHRALSGGMGEVYLCLDLEHKLPFALKTFQARYLTSARAREYFEREAATWVALEKHPNVVRCFYMNKVDNIPFLFLEWVVGEAGYGTDLRDWLDRRGPLEPRLALEFTLDVCRALAHAQRKVPGFVHCDIKPENVLVAQGQLAKLTDFGLAKLVREAGLVANEGAATATARRWQVSSAGGTPPYMAPEQWRGEPFDARTDVYAVGCLLYELLSAHWPFQASRIEDLKRQHLESPVPTLDGIAKGLPAEDLEMVLSRCLAKQPENRFRSSLELSIAISALYETWYGQPPRAVSENDEFTAIDYSNRGNTYADLALHAKAFADFDAAIRLDRNFALAYSNRGITYASLGRYTEALTDYDAAIRLAPNFALAYCNRGKVYAATGDRIEALSDFEAAIRLDPRFAMPYYNRGTIYKSLGRLAEALADFDAAIHLDPNDARAYVNRGNAHADLGKHTEALADYDVAIRLDPNDAKAYSNRGTAHADLGEHGEALANYNVAIHLDPSDAKAYCNRGATYAKLGKHADALADYEAAIRLDPNFAIAYVNKGLLHTLLGEWDNAFRAFETAGCLGSARGADYSARVRQMRGLPPEAVRAKSKP
jgi:tetratricopeptide (TPR) repeat protein